MLTLDTGAIKHPRRSVASIMQLVVIALVPGIVLYTLTIDSRLPGNLLLASVAALFFEAILIKLRQRRVLPVLKDSSVVLAAILLVLSVPQSLPNWQLVFGVFIMCTLGKHVFGGLGHNPFNPAMVAYAVLIVSFPLTMTQWSTHHGMLDNAVQDNAQATAIQDTDVLWDGISGATPLDRIRNLRRSVSDASGDDGVLPDDSENTETIVENSQATGTAADTDGLNELADTAANADGLHELADAERISAVAGELLMSSDWLWLSVAWLLGGLYLLFMRIINWRIPVAFLATLWCLYALYATVASVPTMPALPALFSGAIMLGAFFIATDPVSAATSNPGKLVYAAGIGLLCFVIREFSAYPEGVAFAVLLMNMCVPLIDHAFTRNRVTITTAPENRQGKPR